MLTLPTGTRTVGRSEKDLLDLVSTKLIAMRKWGPEVREELNQAEFRIVSYIEIEECGRKRIQLLGYASVWANGDPDNEWNGHLWFDHLVRLCESVPGERTGLQVPLYLKQVEYVRSQPSWRRIFRAPLHDSVVKFSEERGWKQVRPPSGEILNGIYELPRSAI